LVELGIRGRMKQDAQALSVCGLPRSECKRLRYPSKGRPATRHPSLLGPRAPLHPAYLGDGSDLSGLVDVLGFDGSGPLLSEEVGPPGAVEGTLP
jgi:hypothetical protein